MIGHSDPPTRVAHVVVSLGAGGAEAMLVTLVQALDRTEYEPLVVTLGHAGHLADDLRAAGVPVHTLGAGIGLSSVVLPVRLRRLLLRERVDVVQTWMYHADLIGGLAGRMANIPVVWGVQSGPDTGSRRTTVVRSLCARASSRLPAEIICCAESSRRVHHDLGYADRMTVVPNACNVGVFRPDRDARRLIRAELGVDDDTPLVGMVARVSPMKDHATLVRAIATLRRDIHLVLVGDGVDDRNARLGAAIEATGVRDRCHLLGHRDDVAAIDAALDVFVLSSMSEGLPLSLSEAMATGLPAVATDVGDCREVIGSTGTVVPAGDVDAMAAAIGEILDLTPAARAAKGAAARARVSDRYSVTNAVSGYTCAWQRALRRSRTGVPGGAT